MRIFINSFLNAFLTTFQNLQRCICFRNCFDDSLCIISFPIISFPKFPPSVLILILTCAQMPSRVVCNRWKTLYDSVNKHIFSEMFPIHLPVVNSYARLQFHEKAERLGFRHDSTGVGDKRHVVLWHSTGCVHISLSVYLGSI